MQPWLWSEQFKSSSQLTDGAERSQDMGRFLIVGAAQSGLHFGLACLMTAMM
jgi:hypothetical protein